MESDVIALLKELIANNKEATNARLDTLEERQAKNHAEVMTKLDELSSIRWKYAGGMTVISFLILAAVEGIKSFSHL